MSTLKTILLVVFATTFLQGFAQKPEPVLSIVRQVHDFDWYETQAKAWKQEIDKGSTNAMAWVYWSEANRMAKDFCDSVKWESKKGDYFVPRAQLMEAAEKAIPNSFEFNYLKMQSVRKNPVLSDEYLQKAQSQRPYDNLLLPWLMNKSLTANDKEAMTLVAGKWFEQNEIPQELLITSYNMLMSLDTNAVLMTTGDNDTYPTWVLQYARKIRPDVLVLNLWMAASTEEYREKIFAEMGVGPLNFAGDSNLMSNSNLKKSRGIFQHLIKNVSGRPVYLSLFAPEEVYKEYSKSMYMVGFALKYSPKPFDNLSVLRNNVENKYLLDFLKQSFYNNPSESVAKMIKSSYISVFKMLYDLYIKNGEKTKAKKIKDLAFKIAQESGRMEVMQYVWK